MIKKEIKNEINNILKLNFEDYSISQPPKFQNYDFAINLLAILSKKLKKNPEELSNDIIEKLQKSNLIENIEFAKPCFLNFNISKKRLFKEIIKILNDGNKYPVIEKLCNTEKVLLEFVSANPTGPLHIGHARCADLGDSLARIFTKLGYVVKTEYYVNDVGNQIYSFVGSVMDKCKEIDPNFLNFQEKEKLNKIIKKNFYKGEYIKDIAFKIIKEYKDKKHNYEILTKNIVNEILKLIKDDLIQFRVNFDNWIFESDFHKSGEIDKVIKILKQKQIVYEKDNALWFKSTVEGDEKDRVLVRKTGEKTYFASDIAYHVNKFNRGFDRIINIWGADHHGYVKRLSSAMKLLGYDEKKLNIILYQLVSLKKNNIPIAMSTRAGEFITLREVINEIGIDATRFFLLTRTPDTVIEFDLQLAKKQSTENPVYYIQYAHTRCCGILKQAQEIDSEYTEKILSYLNLDEEILLMKKLLFFPEILNTCISNLSPHYLTSYLLDLSSIFHSYYDKYRVIGEEKNISKARLLLVKSVKIVLSSGLELLGITAPEKM